MLLVCALCQESNNKEEGWKPSITFLLRRTPRLFGLLLAVVDQLLATIVSSVQHLPWSSALGHASSLPNTYQGHDRNASRNERWWCLFFLWSATRIWQETVSNHETPFGNKTELPLSQVRGALAGCLSSASQLHCNSRAGSAEHIQKNLRLLTSHQLAHCNRTEQYSIESPLRAIRQERTRLIGNTSLSVVISSSLSANGASHSAGCPTLDKSHIRCATAAKLF